MWTNLPIYPVKEGQREPRWFGKESEIQTGENETLSWSEVAERMRHQNKSLSSGQLHQWNGPGSMNLIYLPASAFQPYYVWSAVYLYVHFDNDDQGGGNDAPAISWMPTNLHEQRTWLWWWTFSSRTDSNHSLQQWIMALIPSLQFIYILVDLFSHSPYN